MFRFGWLTVSPDDLWVWEKFPNAVFTLVKTAGTNTVAADTGEEFHLGAFELRKDAPTSEK